MRYQISLCMCVVKWQNFALQDPRLVRIYDENMYAEKKYGAMEEEACSQKQVSAHDVRSDLGYTVNI